jgi:large subunit ribosomal protein L6
MSKIGRKPIPLNDVTVEVKGNEVHYKGKLTSGVYVLPACVQATIKEKMLFLVVSDKKQNVVWGLHRALLANALFGASNQFTKDLEINGLGFKAEVKGSNVVLTLGFSHKINYELPKGVTMDVDKTGQKLSLKSSDKHQLGQACARIREFRPPEPYKGTGIKLATEKIMRKAGKAKASV